MRRVEIFPVKFSWEVAFSSFSGEDMHPSDITATAARIAIIMNLFNDITFQIIWFGNGIKQFPAAGNSFLKLDNKQG